MVPAIAIISRLVCLQGTRGSFKYCPKNALLSFCRNMKSAVHVPYAGWLIFACSALARTHDFKNFLSWIQVFCCKTLTIFNPRDTCFRTIISLLVCAVLYVITFTASFVSSPGYAYLSLSTCKPFFMFLHLILCCPSSNCISHAMIKCQMSILISYFPCLTARLFPREDPSIHPLAPLFAYLVIWNSLIRKNVGSLIRQFSSMRFYVATWPRRLLSLLQSSFVVSR